MIITGEPHESGGWRINTAEHRNALPAEYFASHLYPTGRDRALPMERRIEVVEATVAELIALGASAESRTRYDDPEDPVYFVVMHDPEGNEFCVG